MFDDISDKNFVSWRPSLVGKLVSENLWKPLIRFEGLVEMNLVPDSFTIIPVCLPGFQLGDLNRGEWINTYIMEMGQRSWGETGVECSGML